MADEIQKQKWREATRRYIEKNREKVLVADKERKRKKAIDDPKWREERNYKRRAEG